MPGPTARASGSRPAEHDRLRLGVEVERLLAVLLAVAAGLPAAERKLVVDLGARVDPGVAGLDTRRRLTRPGQVSRPDRGAEAERGGVRPDDRLVEVSDPPDRQCGAEHLRGC